MQSIGSWDVEPRAPRLARPRAHRACAPRRCGFVFCHAAVSVVMLLTEISVLYRCPDTRMSFVVDFFLCGSPGGCVYASTPCVNREIPGSACYSPAPTVFAV